MANRNMTERQASNPDPPPPPPRGVLLLGLRHRGGVLVRDEPHQQDLRSQLGRGQGALRRHRHAVLPEGPRLRGNEVGVRESAPAGEGAKDPGDGRGGRQGDAQ